ncbi:alpha/beta fold hydrolase [Alteromonas sp. CYL-A6]|uniref:alpha/beta fold hydrolase n=1 Tax=Alteromonas nitratireducens TaxID=3390813 RepID=UPI0034C3CE60
MIWLAVVIGLLLLAASGAVLITRYRDSALARAFPAQGQITAVPGGTIHWTVNGSGPAVVLVHGLAGNMHNFYALEKALTEHYTVYCLDRPGSGSAHRPLSTDPGFDNQARMLLAWMDSIQLDSALFVGHSMGGAISLNLAMQAPERVRGLALIAPLTAPLPLKPTALARWYFRSPTLRYAVAKAVSPLIQKKMGRKQVDIIFKPEPPVPDFGYRYGGALSMRSGAFLAASGDLAAAQKSLYQQIKHYHSITCPVGVLYGDGDKVLSCRHHVEQMKKSLPDAHYVVLKDRGHMLPITAVTECVELINEVQRQTEAAAQAETASPTKASPTKASPTSDA